jgi:hypothetical protein
MSQYSREELQQEFNLEADVFDQLLRAAGLKNNRKHFNESDRERLRQGVVWYNNDGITDYENLSARYQKADEELARNENGSVDRQLVDLGLEAGVKASQTYLKAFQAGFNKGMERGRQQLEELLLQALAPDREDLGEYLEARVIELEKDSPSFLPEVERQSLMPSQDE